MYVCVCIYIYIYIYVPSAGVGCRARALPVHRVAAPAACPPPSAILHFHYIT